MAPLETSSEDLLTTFPKSSGNQTRLLLAAGKPYIKTRILTSASRSRDTLATRTSTSQLTATEKKTAGKMCGKSLLSQYDSTELLASALEERRRT